MTLLCSADHPGRQCLPVDCQAPLGAHPCFDAGACLGTASCSWYRHHPGEPPTCHTFLSMCLSKHPQAGVGDRLLNCIACIYIDIYCKHHNSSALEQYSALLEGHHPAVCLRGPGLSCASLRLFFPPGLLCIRRTAQQLCNLPGAPGAGASKHRAHGAVHGGRSVHDACLGAAPAGCSHPRGCEGHGPLHHPDCTCPSARRWPPKCLQALLQCPLMS